MDRHLTIITLFLFAGWIIIAFGLAQRRLHNAYANYQKKDQK